MVNVVGCLTRFRVCDARITHYVIVNEVQQPKSMTCKSFRTTEHVLVVS